MAHNSANKLEIWGETDKGRVRPANEDTIFPDSSGRTGRLPIPPDKGQLLIVADGVGGGQAGHTASKFAVEVTLESYGDGRSSHPADNLRAAIETANSAIYQFIQARPSLRDSGSTLVAALAHQGQLYVANVGDSRAYLIRAGQATQLTRDHSLTQHKLDLGRITPEQAADDPDRNVITRSLGAGATVKVDVFPPLDLQPGDVVLLCSDGLSDVVDDAEIARVAASQGPKQAAQSLVKRANKNGGPDNISVVVGRVPGGPAPVAAGGMGSRRLLALFGAGIFFVALIFVAALGWFTSRENQKPTPTVAATITMQAVPAPTDTPVPTVTDTSAAATATDRPTDTPTPVAPTPTRRATSTPLPTNTSTFTPTATRTRVPSTRTPAFTPTPTPGAGPPFATPTTDPGSEPQPTQPPPATHPPPTITPEPPPTNPPPSP